MSSLLISQLRCGSVNRTLSLSVKLNGLYGSATCVRHISTTGVLSNPLQGKVYTITGAAGGIGAATAIQLAKSGAKALSLSDMNTIELDRIAGLCSQEGSQVLVRKLDVTKPDQVQRWISDTSKEFGQLDGSVNSAGVLTGAGNTNVEALSLNDWQSAIDINLTGMMLCIQAELRAIARPGGSIVNLSSASGVRGFPKASGYCASKHGVIGLTSAAAAEYGRQGVRINAVCPGPIDTKMFRDGEKKGNTSSEAMSETTLLGRLGEADEIAKVICFLLSSDSSYVTGAHWLVDGGYTVT